MKSVLLLFCFVEEGMQEVKWFAQMIKLAIYRILIRDSGLSKWGIIELNHPSTTGLIGKLTSEMLLQSGDSYSGILRMQ